MLNTVDLREMLGLVKSFAGSRGRFFKRAPGRRRHEVENIGVKVSIQARDVRVSVRALSV